MRLLHNDISEDKIAKIRILGPEIMQRSLNEVGLKTSN